MNTAKHIAEITGLQPRHIWADVRRRGIEPRKVRGTLALTDAQLEKYLELRESGYYVRTAPAAPAAAVPCKTSNGQTYLYIPAPWEVPAPWEWRA